MENPSKFILPGAILIAAVLISGSIVFFSFNTGGRAGTANVKGNDVKGDKVDVSVDDDPMLGNPKAEVTIVEFSDFQCPFCRTFWRGAFQQIKTEYIDTGKVRFVYRDFPLSFHPAAQPAAEAAQCANDQGKFWEMHDKLFQEQEKKGAGTIQFSETDIKKWASQIPGLDMNKWNECVVPNKYKPEVENDLKDGSAYGVSGTPTTFIGEGKIIIDLQYMQDRIKAGEYIIKFDSGSVAVVGAQPFDVFKAEIDKLLK